MTTDEANTAALDAVSDLVHHLDPGAMVTRFLLVAEVVDADAVRACWVLAAPDAQPWDVLGLASFASHANTRFQEDP